ncbi:MAG: L,D-transpeptidase [Chloroflexi bacterium]|nr:L,D-transpeptidase [Chloroflexota bacterium]
MSLAVEARAALARGDRSAARRLAFAALRSDPACELAWMVLAALSSPAQRAAYLKHALALNPHSQAIQSALTSLLSLPPAPLKMREESIAGAPPASATQPLHVAQHVVPLRRLASATETRSSKPRRRIGWGWAATGVLLSCMLVATATAFARAASAAQNPMVFGQLEKDRGTATPTFTATFTPTVTPSFTPSPTPTFTPSPTWTPRPTSTPLPPVNYDLPPSTGGVRWIDVDLSSQRVFAYEGDTILRTFIVSTGTAAHPTVVGRFRIYVKYRYDDMAGPGYYLPNVPYTMYFYQGYSLHGTYWHHNFGHPMSHGCVNMRTSDAGWLFDFASVGTLVNVHY